MSSNKSRTTTSSSSSSSKKCNTKNLTGYKIGPNYYNESIPPEYELLKLLGKGCYGGVYLGRKINRKKDEDEYYAVKVILDKTKEEDVMKSAGYRQWIREVNCLLNAKGICSDVDIICYKESFISKINNDIELVIVTPLLLDYMTIYDFFKSKYTLTIDEAKIIYKKVVDVVNALIKLCLSHTDMHQGNIMIHPETKDIKVIDLGLCKEDSNKSDYNKDIMKLESLLESLIKKSTQDLEREFISFAPVEKYNPTCIPPIRDFLIPKNQFEFNISNYYYENLFDISLKKNTSLKRNNIDDSAQKLQKIIDYTLKYPEFISPMKLRNINARITGFGEMYKDFQFERFRKELFREYDSETLNKNGWKYPSDYNEYVLGPLNLYSNQKSSKNL